MISQVLQLSSVQSRLVQAAGTGTPSHPVTGWLVGLCDDSQTVVTSVLQRSESRKGNLKADVDEARSLLPAGFSIIGAFICAKQDNSAQTEAKTLCKQCWKACTELSKIPSLTPSSQVWAVVKADEVSWFQSSASAAVCSVQVRTISPPEQQETVKHDALMHADSQWLHTKFTCLCMELSVELLLYNLESSPVTAKPEAKMPKVSLEQATIAAVTAATDSICSSAAAFLATTDQAGSAVIRDHSSQGGAETVASLGCPPGQGINITVLSSTSPDTSAHALHVQYQPVKDGACSLTRTTCNLSIPCYIPDTTPLSELSEKVLKPAIQQQLRAMQSKLVHAGQVQCWTAFQVQPPGWPHLVTVMYPLPRPKDPKTGSQPSELQEQEDALRPSRLQLHQQLGLPANRPLLKFANAVDPRLPHGGSAATPAPGKAVRLQNVHEGIAEPAVKGGVVHMIDGTYDYHHYMQDKCDDAGWGCAYRSLQTIQSWFRHQHYTQLPVLSLTDIQQTLVDIGDKPQAFVGSRDWIGAIELGYVLDTKLGLTCKVMTVSSGAEMSTKARELAQHFDVQGTPVMIGGGVLAYTLLGVSYNKQTGECAFLILDPHYTGEDEISKVQSGQWISWKAPTGRAAAGGPLFVQSAFYNLLLPQRPDTV